MSWIATGLRQGYGGQAVRRNWFRGYVVSNSAKATVGGTYAQTDSVGVWFAGHRRESFPARETYHNLRGLTYNPAANHNSVR